MRQAHTLLRTRAWCFTFIFHFDVDLFPYVFLAWVILVIVLLAQDFRFVLRLAFADLEDISLRYISFAHSCPSIHSFFILHNNHDTHALMVFEYHYTGLR